MDIKNYLEQVRKIDKEISSNIDLIERLRAKELSCTSVLSDEIRSNSKTDKTKITDKRIDLENKIGNDSIKLYNLIDEARLLILTLPDTLQRTVLIEYYLNNRSWEEVAIIVNYSWRQVQRIHGNSLDKLRRCHKMS